MNDVQKSKEQENDISPLAENNYYTSTVNSIKRKVAELRFLITQEDPLSLLKFSHLYFVVNNLGISSEYQLAPKTVYSSRLTEYIQSVLVSCENNYTKSAEDPSDSFFQIATLTEELYSEISQFYILWASDKTQSLGHERTIDLLVESLLLFNVRGNRYPVFEEEYHRYLLSIHDQSFKSIYGFSSDEVVDGLKHLLYSLSQGALDPINTFIKNMDSYDSTSFAEIFDDEVFPILFGKDLNDVIAITGWPESFVSDMAYGIGEVSSFINDSNEYSGWPVLELPIHRKPFIRIDNRFYCFDYYSLSDNFYRAVQHAVLSHSYNEEWNNRQQEASEMAVCKLFRRLIPDADIFRNNYYPKNKTIKEPAENDILIKYEDIIIIIEVKAGSFAHTSPFTDFDAHINAYKNLIEKPDHQCERTNQYIYKSDEIVFYNHDRKPKFTLKKEEIQKTIKISVTVDNINSFAARAEKIGFLSLQSNAICIGLDDLITYSKYFTSPLVFMHYLQQREAAVLTPGLELFDELDHLGLYIEYNCYPMLVKQSNENTRAFFDGFREDLDEYFGSLYHSHLSVKKPVQDLPVMLQELIECIEKSDISNKIWLSTYLLNFDADARKGLCNEINKIIHRQQVEGRMFPIVCSGKKDSLRYCCYISQSRVKELSEEERENHLLSRMIYAGEPDRVMINISVDDTGKPYGISGKIYKQESVDPNRAEKLYKIGESHALSKVRSHIELYGKPGRNEFCPCGSGKKYKKCCGR